MWEVRLHVLREASNPALERAISSEGIKVAEVLKVA
jgi:hypothetical protein